MDEVKIRKFDLEERLIDFSVLALEIVDLLPSKYSAIHLGNQLARSCTSPALNYGEAQGAESQKDFIHKMGIILKELRESKINMTILQKRKYITNIDFLEKTMQENKELIAIFTKSIQTAKNRTS